MDELFDQTKNVFVLGATPPKKFPKQIAFNVIPFIGSFQDDGYTDEEQKMWNETHKILDPEIALTVTCVRVPVMVSHSESVNIEFHEPLDEDEARDILRDAPGVIVIDKREPTGYITPKEAQGEFSVFVSRIRKDPTIENGLNMWVVSDNLRKGAALNAVQIAELLHARGLIRQKALA
jgi:aspartate-semialdehyde dehydrogenase